MKDCLRIEKNPNSIKIKSIVDSMRDGNFNETSTNTNNVNNSNRYCYCWENVDDDLLGCDSCDEWYHAKLCLFMSNSEFKRYNGTRKKFECPDCKYKRRISRRTSKK